MKGSFWGLLFVCLDLVLAVESFSSMQAPLLVFFRRRSRLFTPTARTSSWTRTSGNSLLLLRKKHYAGTSSDPYGSIASRLEQLEKAMADLNNQQPLNANSPKQVALAVFGTAENKSTCRQVLLEAIEQEELDPDRRKLATLVLEYRDLSKQQQQQQQQLATSQTTTLGSAAKFSTMSDAAEEAEGIVEEKVGNDVSRDAPSNVMPFPTVSSWTRCLNMQNVKCPSIGRNLCCKSPSSPLEPWWRS
jgi:hypothetical protein